MEPEQNPTSRGTFPWLGPFRSQLRCGPLIWLSEPHAVPPPAELEVRGPDGRSHKFRRRAEGATWSYGSCALEHAGEAQE